MLCPLSWGTLAVPPWNEEAKGHHIQTRAGASHRDGALATSSDHLSHSGTTPDQHEANGKSSLQQDAMIYRSMYTIVMETVLAYCKLNFLVGL